MNRNSGKTPPTKVQKEESMNHNGNGTSKSELVNLEITLTLL